MINFYEGQITDILPENLKETTDVQALSYALQRAMQKLQTYAKKSRIYSAISDLPEMVLDILAIELRAQYYSEDMDIETKRNIIQNTLLWYRYAGTPWAVEKLIGIIFGTGEVIEWYNYSGDPGHFKIATENYNLTGDELQEFNSIIEHVKRKSSILDAIEITLNAFMNTYYGFAVITGDNRILKQEG